MACVSWNCHLPVCSGGFRFIATFHRWLLGILHPLLYLCSFAIPCRSSISVIPLGALLYSFYSLILSQVVHFFSVGGRFPFCPLCLIQKSFHSAASKCFVLVCSVWWRTHIFILSVLPPSFLTCQDSVFYHFLSISGNSFDHSFSVDLQVKNYHSFPSSRMFWFPSPFSRDIFTGCRILGQQFFSFSTWKMLRHFLLASMVFDEKFTVIWIVFHIEI